LARVHYRSDVYAGHFVGAAIRDALFDNPAELARMVSETKCEQLDVRLNPANLGSVLVYHPKRREYFEVPSLCPFPTLEVGGPRAVACRCRPDTDWWTGD